MPGSSQAAPAPRRNRMKRRRSHRESRRHCRDSDIEVVLIGTNDLCAEIGIPGQFADPRVEAAYRSVIAACRKHGVHPGTGSAYDFRLMQHYIGMGMRFILSGGDFSFLMAGARSARRLPARA
jgi:2-keto-3-deoxy-L-rhamnonate aldolase RhmA